MRDLLRAMIERPPDVLVVQTHNVLVSRDVDLLVLLAGRCSLWVSITVETEQERIPGFANHASSPAKRIETLVFHKRQGEDPSVRGEPPAIDNGSQKVQIRKLPTAERFSSTFCRSAASGVHRRLKSGRSVRRSPAAAAG